MDLLSDELNDDPTPIFAWALGVSRPHCRPRNRPTLPAVWGYCEARILANL